MNALQPLLAIVTLLLCFCGTLAFQSNFFVPLPRPWFRNRVTHTQPHSATTTTNPEDQSKLLQGGQPNAAQPAPSGVPVPVPPSGLTAQPPAAQSDDKQEQAASNEADRSQDANAALKDKDNQKVAGVKQANLQGIFKDPSSIKGDKVVQATHTQLHSATTTTNSEDLSKPIRGSQPNAAQPASSGFPVPVPPPGLTAKPPAAQSDKKLKQAANNEADRRQVANAALKGKYNQKVARVKQANLQGIVKDPSSINGDKVVQATHTQLHSTTTTTNSEDLSKPFRGSQPNAAQPAPSGFPVPVPPSGLTAQPPAAQSDDKLKQAANNEGDRRQDATWYDGTCHPIIQKITGLVSPLLKRFYKNGPAQVVM